jgi:hypothetical protein
MAVGPIIKNLLISFSSIRDSRTSPLVPSLYEMSNLKRLVPQHYRVPRQSSGNRLPPVEILLLRRLYFLNLERSKYICLGFYPSMGYRVFFELSGVRQAPVVFNSISHHYTGTSPT